MQRRGCTRLEISLYSCDTEDLSQTVAEELIAEALELANIEEGLFIAQPPAKQWENLVQHLDLCMLLGDREQGAIYLAWSGHSKTGRVQGMLVKPTAEMVADDAKWDRAMHWTMADFGLKNCPIFHVEIVGEIGRKVLFSPLYSITKVGPTILAASKRLWELHPGAPNPQDLLPTRHVEWVWRTKRTQRIGVEKPSCELVEVQQIAEGRHISTLLSRNRLLRLMELIEARKCMDWEARMEKIAAIGRENVEKRHRELERLEEATRERHAIQEEKAETGLFVEEALGKETKKSPNKPERPSISWGVG